jgi:hypothetical protein
MGQMYKKQKISIVYASEVCVMVFQWPNHDIKILGLVNGFLPYFVLLPFVHLHTFLSNFQDHQGTQIPTWWLSTIHQINYSAINNVDKYLIIIHKCMQKYVRKGHCLNECWSQRCTMLLMQPKHFQIERKSNLFVLGFDDQFIL